MTELTNDEFSTHDSANCPAVMPLLSAWRLISCASLSDSGRHSVCIMRGSLRPARVLAGGGIGRVFAGQDAARQRAVGHDAEPVVTAGRKMLDLGHAVHRIV